MKEALYYKKLKNKIVNCNLCPTNCVIKPDNLGNCGARKNIDGKLYSLVYAKPVSVSIDPIEKKPLYHFLPGSYSLSIGTLGCNLHCLHCFTSDTFVVTDDGTHQFEELYKNSRNEYAYNNVNFKKPNKKAITHKGKVRRITKISKHNYSGKIINIKPYYLPNIKCTPNHQFFVFSNQKIIKKEAENISYSDYLIIPKKFDSRIMTKIDTKSILESFNFSNIRRSNKKIDSKIINKIIFSSEKGKSSKIIGNEVNLHPVHVRRILSKIRKKGLESLFSKKLDLISSKNFVRLAHEKNRGIPKILILGKNLATLFGYYCAEGCASKVTNRPNTYYLRFCFGKHETRLINKTKELILNIFDINPKVVDQETTTIIRVDSSSIALLFKILFGSGANNKSIPTILFKADKTFIKEFLKAYIEGDGWIGKYVISINTTSKRLAYGIYELFLRIGLLPTFYSWRPPHKKMIRKRIINQSQLYYVKLGSEKFRNLFLNKNAVPSKKSIVGSKFKELKDYFLVPINTISKENYNGYVYNLEVEKDHSYLANFVSVANCQNWEISQSKADEFIGKEVEPKELIESAIKNNCKSISYTYNEPTIFYEYVLETAKLARKKGIKNIMVTNGYINKEPLKELYPLIDAANIDLKAFDEDFYKKICSVRLEPILEAIKEIKKIGTWVELTNLIIPGYNDSKEKIEKLVKWVKENVGIKIPLHFSAFYPTYKLLDAPRTSPEILLKAKEIALKYGLKYIYLGNTSLPDSGNTYCPKCNKLLIERGWFEVYKNNIKKNLCPYCNEKIDGVFE